PSWAMPTPTRRWRKPAGRRATWRSCRGWPGASSATSRPPGPSPGSPSRAACPRVPPSGTAAYGFVERLLSGTIGAASARVVVGTARRRALWMPGSVREVLHDATAAIRYNADLLRKTLDHVGLGIAVFDAEGKLEIWNERFAA